MPIKSKYGLKTNLKNWKKTILNPSHKMQDAIKILNDESFKIVLVTNKSNVLLGTITDGDIRRALLKNLDLKTKIKDFMFKKPSFASDKLTNEEILKLMQDNELLQMPILNAEKKVIGLETLQNLVSNETLKNPVLLMAGGFGKRLRPLTYHTPKSMLEIGGKPILEIIIGQFKSLGFKNIYISTYYKADMIKKYFSDGAKIGMNIKYLLEKKPSGTAGALSLLPKNIIKLPLIIMNSDLLTKVDFVELLEFHNKTNADVTVCVRGKDFKIPYGVIEHNETKIIKLTEKPSQKIFINAGIYVVNHSVIKKYSKKSYRDMPDLINAELKRKSNVLMFPIHEYWTDIGEIAEYTKASSDIKNLKDK